MKQVPNSLRNGLLTIFVMSLLVFLLIPWQVAFLACYLIHFHHCAILLQSPNDDQAVSSTRSQKLFVLLAMTWCLPVVAPVLAVWVRTLATAGLTTPFDGDHFVLNAISFVALTYAMVTTRGALFQRRLRYTVQIQVTKILLTKNLQTRTDICPSRLCPRSNRRLYDRSTLYLQDVRSP